MNLSARQFQRPELVTEITAAVGAAGLDPHALTLEITESVVMADPATAAATLNELKELGVAVSIDDFGTGYSSLDLAQALHVTITADFIETPLQEAALRALGCECGQGYLFARPRPALALEAMLEDRAEDRAA